MGKLVVMSHKEIHRLEIIQRVAEGRLYQSEAAEQLGISERQVRRLLRSYEGSGALGLVHKCRACPSNRRLPKEQLDEIMAIVRDKYYDFGPTLAAEKLAEIDGIQISKETLRKLMVEAGLWKTRTQRLKRAYQPRNKRRSTRLPTSMPQTCGRAK